MWAKVASKLAAKYVPDVDTSGNMSESEYVQRVTDCVRAHLHLDWELGMRGKAKLQLYLQANEGIEFKPYLKGPLTTGKKLLFRFRSGNVGLNGNMAMTNREQDPSCPCCDNSCEDVVHAIIQCPHYQSHRTHFLHNLHTLIGDHTFAEFNTKSDMDKCLCILSPKWWNEAYRDDICCLAKEFLCNLWQSRLGKINGPQASSANTTPAPQLGSASMGGAEVYGHLTTTPNI